MQLFQPEEVIVERGSEASPIYRNLRNALPLIPFRTVDAFSTENGRADFSASTFGASKKRLVLTRHKGEFLKKCPGSDGQVCCNYFVINFASNCPMDCSYCYLQEYLADNPELKVFSNVDNLLTEADELLNKHRRFFFRIGTGEITDSLALDPYIGFTREIVPFFAEQPNVLLELKTKSDCVEGLLLLDPKDRVVVSWSMNPQRVIDLDEHGTASLSERLLAARRCQDAGYRLGFHFDPIVEYPNWENDYEDMLDQIFGSVDWRRIAWLSMGVLRDTPSLKRIVRESLSADTASDRRASALSGREVALFSTHARRYLPQDDPLDSPSRTHCQSLSLHGVQRSMGAGLRFRAKLRKGAWQPNGTFPLIVSHA